MRRNAAVLLEILISIALFAGAAVFALGAAHSTFDAMDRVRRRQEAVDLARSRMAMLESGLATLADLRDQTVDASGSASGIPAWSIDVQVQRTEYTGLSLVEVTVSEESAGGFAATETGEQSTISYTLRQLVPLGEVVFGGDEP